MTFLIITAIGPTLYALCSNVPLGFVLQLVLPGPEDAALGVLKAIIDAGLLTGASVAAILR